MRPGFDPAPVVAEVLHLLAHPEELRDETLSGCGTCSCTGRVRLPGDRREYCERSRASMVERLGDDAPTDRADEWLDWLGSAYRKLGHDPADIRRGSAARV